MSSLFDTKRGTQWSFSITVQGLPWVYTDGVASWASKWAAPYIEMPSCLVTREFDLKWLSNGQDPLQTGGGISVELADDGTDIVFRTWSKDHKGRSGFGRLSQSMGAASTDTTVYIAPSTATELLAVDSYIFVGPETMRITNASTPGQRTVTRAQFDTLRHVHRVFDTVRPSYATSPTSFEGRVVTLWVAPVDPLTGLLDELEATPIWAGVLKEARIIEDKVKLELEPLSHMLKQDWPAVVPSATLLPRVVSAWAPSTNHFSIYTIIVRFGVTGEDFYLSLGEFDDSGTFAVKPITLPAEYTLNEYVKWVQDTIINFADTDPRSPYIATANFRMTSQFGLSVVAVTEGSRRGDFDIMAFSLLNTPIWIRGRGLPNTFWSTVRPNISGLQRITSIRDRVAYMSAEQTTIRIKLDRPAHPFETTWSWDGSSLGEVGYAVIGDKENHELIRFSGVTIDPDDASLATLTGCARGIAGTEAQAWGKPEGDESSETSDQTTIKDRSGAVTLSQPFMVAEPTNEQSGGNVADLIRSSYVPLYALLSSEDRGQNGTYDRLDGYRQALALPQKWVDTASFEALARAHNLPLLASFWVSEQGKGKESLQELLKMAGVYLVERRFLDSEGNVQYGIGVESIDLPTSSSFARTLTEEHQVAGSRGSTTHNERLIVNNTKLKPHLTWGAKDAKGDEIFYWDEWSIAEYGPSKQLEFKPTAVFGTFDNRYGGEAYRDRAGQAAWLYEVSNRWFASFGRGAYGGEIEVAAPYVYNYQIGDLVYLDLATLRNSEGGAGLVAVGHITKVEHRWGTRASGRVGWRSSIDDFSELAPVARATISSTTSMSVATNIYSYAADRSPFGGGWAAKDIQWFDTAQHGGSIECKGWVVGNYAGTVQNFTITATNLTTGVLTCAADLHTKFGAAATIIFTFASWPSTSTSLTRQYAYVANSAGLAPGIPAKEYS